MKPRLLIPTLSILVALLAFSCGRTDSVNDATEDGFTSLIQMVDEPPGENCEAGGVAIHSGLDANRNGVLDTEEVAVTKYVCDGTEGTSGHSTLFESDVEPPGDNCPAGGTVFRWGLDEDDDGVLDADEIQSTEYVCNGLPGEGHNSLVNTLDEPQGENCTWGGLAIQTGLDENDDGVLQPGEVTGTTYVCNGSDGLDTLVRQEDELPGTNCPDGGKAVLSGLDSDRSGYLDDSEVLSTSYICNGPQGDPGYTSLFDADIEPPGETCPAGGFLIKSGLDTNENGILDDDEIQAEAYLCQGVPGDDGVAALVQVTEEDPGTNCWYGGQKIETGGDDNADGVLDPSEVDFTQYACNGAPGSNGSNGVNSLVETTDEPPGSNCPGGGQRVDVGLDSNRNNTLDSTEITSTEYVCHGGDILMRVSDALWGGVCPRGGVKVESGFDDNADSVLQDSEVDAVQYVCNLYYAQIESGLGKHTCGLISDGTVRCWGLNDHGQLGDGTTDNRHIPVAVSGLSNVTSLSAGGFHTCALIANGTVRCWGYNEYGQLGNNTVVQHNSPVNVLTMQNTNPVILNDIISISAGGAHSCAVQSGGQAFCWGFNLIGQLGNNSTTPSPVAVEVNGPPTADDISAGGYHTCAAYENGKARCWGYNGNGQLGINSDENKLEPTEVYDLNDVTSISAGGEHTCALEGNVAVCWGRNDSGQLGEASFDEQWTPVAVSGLVDVSYILAGGYHSCAVVANDTPFCWGLNDDGQVGDGTKTVSNSPQQVVNLSGVSGISSGGIHTCSLLSDGSARCWGDNEFGQLGDGTTFDRPTPGSAPIQ